MYPSRPKFQSRGRRKEVRYVQSEVGRSVEEFLLLLCTRQDFRGGKKRTRVAALERLTICVSAYQKKKKKDKKKKKGVSYQEATTINLVVSLENKKINSNRDIAVLAAGVQENPTRKLKKSFPPSKSVVL